MNNEVTELEKALYLLFQADFPHLPSFMGEKIRLKIDVENGSQVMNLITYLDSISYGTANGVFYIYLHLRTSSVMGYNLQSCAIKIIDEKVYTEISLEYLKDFYQATFKIFYANDELVAV